MVRFIPRTWGSGEPHIHVLNTSMSAISAASRSAASVLIRKNAVDRIGQARLRCGPVILWQGASDVGGGKADHLGSHHDGRDHSHRQEDHSGYRWAVAAPAQ